MSDLEEFSTYWTQDPQDEDYAIVSINLKVKKTLLQSDILTEFAKFHGWQPSDTINAADKSIAVIKGMINERGAAVVAAIANKTADNIKSSLAAEF